MNTTGKGSRGNRDQKPRFAESVKKDSKPKAHRENNGFHFKGEERGAKGKAEGRSRKAARKTFSDNFRRKPKATKHQETRCFQHLKR